MQDFLSIQCKHYIAKEFEQVNRVGTDNIACGCLIRIIHRLDCACKLENIQTQGDPVPLEFIHVFWRKLHIKEYEVIEEERNKVRHTWT